MTYHQITSEERYRLSALRKQGWSTGEIAAALGRHRSTIWREVHRNAKVDGSYRPTKAIEYAGARRRRSRRNRQFDTQQLALVEGLLQRQWSPEQISGHQRRHGSWTISHETIYRYVWHDWRRGGQLYQCLRGARKQRRKRYRRYDSRGRLAGKRHISERPAVVETRRRIGDWEIDTVMGTGSKHCLVSLVERRTGFLLLGKLRCRTTEETNRGTLGLIRRHRRVFKTITADNGTEFHDYAAIERRTQLNFYFATPHHSWERGTNENTNGLIRQYFPRGMNLRRVTQADCNAVADRINSRPRKRHGYRTPKELFYGS
jgi:IS30 family transposase